MITIIITNYVHKTKQRSNSRRSFRLQGLLFWSIFRLTDINLAPSSHIGFGVISMESFPHFIMPLAKEQESNEEAQSSLIKMF